MQKGCLLPQGSLIERLLVAWGCGLLWGAGLFWMVLLCYGIFFPIVFLILFLLGLPVVLGLITIIASPALLSFSLTRRWRESIVNGLLAALAGIVSSLSFVWAFFWMGFDDLLYYLLVGATGVVPVTIVILTGTEAFPRRDLGLGVGFTVGLGLSIVSWLVLGEHIFPGGNILHLVWQMQPLVWGSVVYFPELMAKRGGWKEFILWILLMSVAFSLPFVIVPAFNLR